MSPEVIPPVKADTQSLHIISVISEPVCQRGIRLSIWVEKDAGFRVFGISRGRHLPRLTREVEAPEPGCGKSRLGSRKGGKGENVTA